MQLFYGLHFKNLFGDIYGGLVAAVVALPLALAFGVASGAGALAGLYGAIIVGFFAALFGGTPAQVSGPTRPMTVVMAGLVAQFRQQPPLACSAVPRLAGRHSARCAVSPDRAGDRNDSPGVSGPDRTDPASGHHHLGDQGGDGPGPARQP